METILISVVAGLFFAVLGLASMHAQAKVRASNKIKREPNKFMPLSAISGDVRVSPNAIGNDATRPPTRYNSAGVWKNRSGQQQATSVGTVGR